MNESLTTDDHPVAPSYDDEAGSQKAHDRWVLAFVRLWALAHLTHLTIFTGQRFDSVWNIGCALAAIVLLLRPQSGRWLIALCALQLADMIWEMPFSPDHWMLVGFVNLALVLGFVWRRTTAIGTVAAVFPTARWLMLVAYSSAALAKYNTTFLDPVGSCATAMARRASLGLTTKMDAGPTWLIITLAFETAIPLLLLFPATRRHGVRVGLIFHFAITASPVISVEDFSMTLYALFFLFLTDDDAGRMLDSLAGLAGRSAVVRDARRLPWVTASLGFVIVGFTGYANVVVGFALQVVLTTLLLGMLLVVGLLSWPRSRGARSVGLPLLVHVPVVVALAFWAASPYLGLRTTGVFTMFSSLRTEGELGNHLFLPTVHLTDWQEDFVVIQRSNDAALDGAEGGHLGVPLMTLRRMAMDNPDLVVVGELHGTTVTFGPVEGQRELRPLSWWEDRFLMFRSVTADGEPYCGVS